jgi:hypothetical protein
VAVAACGGSGGGSAGEVFCDQTTSGVHICNGQSYSGPSAVDETNLTMAACTQAGGKILTACPTVGLLGDCTTTVNTGTGSGSVDVFSYALSGEPAASQQATYQMVCTQHGGTWKSAP